jgi:uncharacterized membrane protein YcaP (DUF421 family)
MTGPDTSLFGGVAAACTLLLLNYLVANLSGVNRRFRKIVEGQPSLLVHDGKVIESHMKRECVSMDERIAPCASTASRDATTWPWACWKWMDPSVA